MIIINKNSNFKFVRFVPTSIYHILVKYFRKEGHHHLL